MGIRRYIHSCPKGVFLIGFVIGALLAVLFNKTEDISHCKISITQRKRLSYSDWFRSNGLIREPVDNDILLYGNSKGTTEAEYLKKKIFILCAVFVHKLKNAEAVKNTWGKHCNDIVFFGVMQSDSIPVIHFKPRNSFHFLCDCIHYIVKKYHQDLQWTLFVYDDIYAIPENLRYYVASLDYNISYYLGHALMFWGQMYNMAQAGYVLSRSAMFYIHSTFNTTESCQKGGKYWKNEDFYLGKHLEKIGVYPKDTRDNLGKNRFLGYNLKHLLFPGRLSKLTRYWKKSVYPVAEGLGCCSDSSITFHGMEAHKLYLYDYLLNHLRVFNKPGVLGNKPAPTPFPDEKVWKEFLKEQGKENESVSSDEFFELWKSKISAPDAFNERLRQEHLNSFVTGFANMPHVLESMLSAVRANESEHE